jgi:hypothetical protein
MATQFNFYVVCPACKGTGNLIPNDLENPVIKQCDACKNESGTFGAKVFDGVRHIYAGKLEKVKD